MLNFHYSELKLKEKSIVNFFYHDSCIFFIFCVLKLMKMHESTVSESQDSASMLTNDSALVTIDRSTRTSDIFLDNVESDYRRREIGSVKEVSDTEQDLPRHE